MQRQHSMTSAETTPINSGNSPQMKFELNTNITNNSDPAVKIQSSQNYDRHGYPQNLVVAQNNNNSSSVPNQSQSGGVVQNQSGLVQSAQSSQGAPQHQNTNNNNNNSINSQQNINQQNSINLQNSLNSQSSQNSLSQQQMASVQMCSQSIGHTPGGASGHNVLKGFKIILLRETSIVGMAGRL